MNPVIYVVDDDAAVRNGLQRLLEAEAYNVCSFASPLDFLAHPLQAVPGCLILDMNMPEADGFTVTTSLRERGHTIPTIFLTGFGTIPVTVKAMKAGAWEFLTKPADPEKLLQSVAEAIRLSASALSENQETHQLTQRLHSLTPRERELMELAVSGLLNKQIATAMGVSEITAKVHKRRVMEKMQARSPADLVRIAERLSLFKTQVH